MLSYWMPPMEHVSELIARHGVTGVEAMGEALICEGDLGRLEHLVHELAHAALLDIVVDGERRLSAAISDELAARAEAQQDVCVPVRYELETFAVESMVIERLGLPITMPDLLNGLEIQVAQTYDDYIRRFMEARDLGHVAESVERVCERIAPGGRPEMRRGLSGAVFWRLDGHGREITVYPMTFGNARLCISEAGDDAILDGFCYQSDANGDGLTKAIRGGAEWDGEGNDPPGGWYRNPQTGRRRPGGDRSKETIYW